MALRKLKASDFKEHDWVYAVYNGNSRYLVFGEEYCVTISRKTNKATVQLSCNPKLNTSNGGVQFSFGTFLIEEEEELKLEDLSQEDRYKLLLEAKALVEKENLEKNATEMYSLMRKNYVSEKAEQLEEFAKTTYTDKLWRKINRAQQVSIVERVNGLVNLIFKFYSKSERISTQIKITSGDEWEAYQNMYVNICKAVEVSLAGQSLSEVRSDG